MKKIIALLLTAVFVLASAVTAYAAVPEPVLTSKAGIVMNADTGEVYWSKDAETKYYPASITKVMTALLVMEKCKNLDETVTFSKTATTNLESGAVTIQLEEGDKLSVRECLYALMLKSANEVANGLAEHIAGSVSAFADMMNQRAKELGCTNTHFVNPNGLNNENHYTTAHDMALITAAAFKYEELRIIDTTQSHKLPPTKKYPDGLTLKINNKILMPGHEKYYQYALAGKTGYTSKAKNTLVTMAQKDNVRLVTVTLKNTKYLGHYDDTKAMFEYGFEKAAASPLPAQNTAETAAESTAETAAETAAAETAAGPSGETTAELVGPGVTEQ